MPRGYSAAAPCAAARRPAGADERASSGFFWQALAVPRNSHFTHSMNATGEWSSKVDQKASS